MTDGLVAALARCQLAFPAIVKSHTNPAFKGSQYADVADVLAAVRPVLAAEGIVVSQATDITDDGGVVLVTSLGFGGEKMQSRFPLQTHGLNAQGVGSLMTYHRRYQLCALLGVHPVGDDDDGNFAATAQTEPEALEGHRAEIRDAIAELSPGDQELVKLEMRNRRVPTLTKPGATLTQLNDLRYFIEGLKERVEPFELDGAEQLPARDDPHDKPFTPVETPVSASERRAVRSTLKREP